MPSGTENQNEQLRGATSDRSELDVEALQMEAVRALLARFEAKIQRILDRVWGNSEPE